MPTTTIPPGYRLTVTSWENDADNYNTKMMEGLSKDEVSFLVDLCKLMGDDNPDNDNHKKRLSNMYEPSDAEVDRVQEAVVAVLRKHNKVENEEHVADHGMEYLYDLGLSCGEWFTRVCESWKVEFIPREIVLEDVTDSFKG